MKIDEGNQLVMFVVNHLKHYDHKKYWKMRDAVVDPNSHTPKLIRLIYLFRIKRMDAYGNASMGTAFGWGAHFEIPPNLIHYLNGIIISHYATIGRNCTIMKQVTIAENNQEAAVNGDNCLLVPG